MNKTEQIKKIIFALEAKGCHILSWCCKNYHPKFFSGEKAICNFMVIVDPLKLIPGKLNEISKELGASFTSKMVEKNTDTDLLGIWWNLDAIKNPTNLPEKVMPDKKKENLKY